VPDPDLWSPLDPGLPAGRVRSTDGTSIAWFRAARPGSGRTSSPLLLIHGATADHTTFRAVGDRFAARRPVYAMDRRGRGASGDGPPGEPYAIEREFDDVALVVATIAAAEGRPIDVLGHSFGGRVAIGAAAGGAAAAEGLRRLVLYESAPAAPGMSFELPGLVDRLRRLEAAGDRDALMSAFMSEVVGLTDRELAAYRAGPTWPVRLRAAHTIVRELTAEAGDGDEDAIRRLGGSVRIPVLQLLGGESREVFRAGTAALDAALPDGEIVVLPGQKHAAHHGDPSRFVSEVERFLDRA